MSEALDYGAQGRRRFAAAFDAETVTYRLEEAGRTLLALPRAGYPASWRTAWPEIVRDAAEAYGYTAEEMRPAVPNAHTITRMDEALRWVGLIPLLDGPRGSGARYSIHGPAVLRRLVLMRALVSPRTGRHLWSFRRLGAQFGVAESTIRLWHSQGIDRIVAALGKRQR